MTYFYVILFCRKCNIFVIVLDFYIHKIIANNYIM